MSHDVSAEAEEFKQAVPQEIINEYLRIRQENLNKSKIYYFDEIMPRIRPLLENRPKHVMIRNDQQQEGFDTLVSLMGFSPETTVHAAVILRPKRLVIAFSENAKESARPAIDYLRREKIIDEFDMELVRIDAFDPQDIYDKLHGYLKNAGRISATTENDPNTRGRVVFDITGGTKLMSATAGALAWERNLRLCYLDGGWDPKMGAAGMARSSDMTVIRNPSRLRGYHRRNEAMENYKRGNFVAAAEGFEESQRLIDDSFFDLLARTLCKTYCILADFDRDGLVDSIKKLEETVDIGGVRKIYEGNLAVQSHFVQLRKFAEGDLVTMTALLLELAETYSNQGRFDFSGLLLYRAMEALVEIGLKQRAPKFRMEAPDVNAIPMEEAVLRQEFSQLVGSGDAVIPQREITLQVGFGLLCILDNTVALRFMGIDDADARDAKAIRRHAGGKMMKLGEIRNKSYLAHGFRTLSIHDSEELRSGAVDLARAILDDQQDHFEQVRNHIRPLDLQAVHARLAGNA